MASPELLLKINPLPKSIKAELPIIKKQENPPLRQAKGLEKLILTLKDFIIAAQFAVIKLLFGKYEIQNDETKSKIEKAFDKGVIYILSKIASVDFCKIVSSGLNSVRVGDSFNPDIPPLSSASAFEKRKWQIQYIAFRIQSRIDDFNALFGTDIGQDMRLGLKELLTEINLNLDQLRSEEAGISNKEIADNFPQTKIALNYINQAISQFSTYVNKNISQEEVKDILKIIGDIRDIAIGIQALNTPANLISTVDSLTGGNLDDEIKKLEEFISSRGEPIRFIKYLLKQANSFNSTARSVLGYITLGRTMIKLLLLLIKVFYVIRFWITGNPTPSLFTPMGAVSTVEDNKNLVIDRKGIFNFIARLQQFEVLLRETAELAEIMVVGATEMISKLTLIKLNLESCNPKFAKEIDDVIQETSRNSQELKKFLDDINKAVETNNTTFGKYTIAIVSEELADEGIRLKRRYGIARDSNNFIVVQTTPTFASLDQIIINEVKFLLASKGLVKSSVSVLSPDDTIVYENALAFLGDDTVEFNIDALNLDVEGLDTKGDIGSFVSNLQGGAAFRKQSRSKIIANNEKLLKNLKSTDPDSKYADSISKTTQEKTNKLKIEKLEDEKKVLQASIAAAATNPITAAGIPKIIEKIKQIDSEIESLKRS